MEKEEVLQRAQQEGLRGADEGTKQMENRGRLFGRTAFTLVFIVLTSAELFADASLNHGTTAMYLAFVAGEVFSEWQFRRKPVYLFLAVVAALTALLALGNAIAEMLG